MLAIFRLGSAAYSIIVYNNTHNHPPGSLTASAKRTRPKRGKRKIGEQIAASTKYWRAAQANKLVDKLRGKVVSSLALGRLGEPRQRRINQEAACTKYTRKDRHERVDKLIGQQKSLVLN